MMKGLYKSILSFWMLVWSSFSGVVYVNAAELVLQPLDARPASVIEVNRPDQIPHSHVATGKQDITAVWLARATDRYPHGVLGDDLEAARLAVETHRGELLTVDLPSNRVFEDLHPRLIDLDADGHDEIVVVESDTRLGASLAVYGIVNQQLVKRAATPFLGRANRWLNPVGAGDFDGDGKLELALVATPHIGGRLRLYRFTQPELTLFAEYIGVSTHSIGSTELGLGRVVMDTPRDQLLMPDQSHRKLMLLEWTLQGWEEHASLDLPFELRSSLMPIGDKKWQIRASDKLYYEVRLFP